VRLGSRVLTGALLAATALGAPAQDPASSRDKRLPWEAAQAMPPWQAAPEGLFGAPPPLLDPAPSTGRALHARFDPDGSLRILDRRGVLRLKLGLPGRVVRMWKDGGREVESGTTRLDFPVSTTLGKGASELPWGMADFRPGLEGLLWILDDGERILTVVHPATARVQYLALPPVSDPELVFWPDHLELRERAGIEAGRQRQRRWSLPWPGLLPQLLRLAQPAKEGRHGTAFQPFPKD
jgi:hypothetical protein